MGGVKSVHKKGGKSIRGDLNPEGGRMASNQRVNQKMFNKYMAQWAGSGIFKNMKFSLMKM